MENPDFFTTVYASFNRHQVRYLISGAFAVNFHGHPRDTGGLDLWVDTGTENLPRIFEALQALGYPAEPAAYLHLKHGDGIIFLQEHNIVRLIPQLANVTPFQQAWERSVATEVYGESVHVLALEDLLNDKMKRATPTDINDVTFLIKAFSERSRKTV